MAAEEAELPSGITVVRIADGRIGSGLNNNGDEVRLVDAGGTVVDSVAYREGGAVAAPPEGETIGRRENDGSWAQTSRATPGAANEFPAAAIATPAGPNGAGPSAKKGPEPSVETVNVREADPRESPVVWVLLGAAIAIGGFAGVTGAPRGLRRLRQQWRSNDE